MKAYYNDNDRQAAAWLRELMREGLIPQGEVDERSIEEVCPEDLRGYNQCHFFAGIGGWSYALRLAGVPDDFPVWTGSCPCQPLSCAGKRRGHEDDRHLWPAFYRLIRECRPAIVFGEQVDSKDGLEWIAGIQTDMEDAGYAVASASLNAAGVSSPHIRQRLYWGAGRLANATISRLSSVQDRREQYAQRYADSVGTPSGVGMADTESTELSRAVTQAGRTVRRSTDGCGMAVAVWNRRRGGRDGHSMGEGKPCDPETETAGSSPSRVGMADADHAGLQGWNGAVLRERSRQFSAWQDSTYHFCRDGKHRRIPLEPALFPLADGFPERVGLLRGAGNSIVPQCAAIFIEAFLEALEENAEQNG